MRGRSGFLSLGIILVFVQICIRDLVRGNAIVRNLSLGTPRDGVEDNGAEVVVSPVSVEVSPGETEAPSAVRSLVGPGQMLNLPALESGLDVGVAGVESIPPFHCAGGGMGGENGCDSLHPLLKAHVEIPLVSQFERFYSPGNGMLGQFLEVCVPMRIDGPVPFEVSADPIEELTVFMPVSEKLAKKQAADFVPGIYPGDKKSNLPDGVSNYKVVGKLMGWDATGQIAVQAGRRPLRVQLGEEAKMNLRLNQLSLAQPGDAVTITGSYRLPDDTKVIAKMVSVTTDRVQTGSNSGSKAADPKAAERGKPD